MHVSKYTINILNIRCSVNVMKINMRKMAEKSNYMFMLVTILMVTLLGTTKFAKESLIMSRKYH